MPPLFCINHAPLTLTSPHLPPPPCQVSLRYAQDGSGVPVSLMQDALHYPHGTKWMAPGPLGQVRPTWPLCAVHVVSSSVARNLLYCGCVCCVFHAALLCCPAPDRCGSAGVGTGWVAASCGVTGLRGRSAMSCAALSTVLRMAA